jgi:uncharacterized OB-fold protein
MKLVIFTIRDNVAEVFNKPFTDLNIASAVRSFTLSLKEEPQKADYTLYKIGEMDQITGTIENDKDPVKIMSGMEVETEVKQETDGFPSIVSKQAS